MTQIDQAFNELRNALWMLFDSPGPQRLQLLCGLPVASSGLPMGQPPRGDRGFDPGDHRGSACLGVPRNKAVRRRDLRDVVRMVAPDGPEPLWWRRVMLPARPGCRETGPAGRARAVLPSPVRARPGPAVIRRPGDEEDQAGAVSPPVSPRTWLTANNSARYPSASAIALDTAPGFSGVGLQTAYPCLERAKTGVIRLP